MGSARIQLCIATLITVPSRRTETVTYEKRPADRANGRPGTNEEGKPEAMLA
jgi:hypothetical protein